MTKRFPDTTRSPVVAQGCPDPATLYGSGYWVGPAAHASAREVVGAVEPDPERPKALPS